MFEKLGPNLARTIMGAAYNPAYIYELETDGSGFHVHITDPTTGETRTVDLEPDPPSEEKLQATYEVEREYKRHRLMGLPLVVLEIIVVLGAVTAGLYFAAQLALR